MDIIEELSKKKITFSNNISNKLDLADNIKDIITDDIIVELNGPEVPIMDGSSLPFIEIIEGCTIKSLKAKRKILKI